MHSHLHQNQNQCVEQPNRMLANGPNHPGPGPEEIPMVDVSLKFKWQTGSKVTSSQPCSSCSNMSVYPSIHPSLRPDQSSQALLK